MSAETLAAFFAASVVLALVPGPDNLFVLTQSAMRGRVAGIAVTCGLCTGLLGHTAAVALGVAALLQASAVAFTVLKLAGAAYLLYLAWQALRAPVAVASAAGDAAARGLELPRLYRRGIVMNLTNPKVSIFFLAFLPQFVDPARGAVTAQIGVLGAAFMVATLLVFGSVALLAGWVGERLARSSRAQRILNRVAAAVFAGLALRLATAVRS